MSILNNKRNNKEKWTSVVLPSSTDTDLSTEELDVATDLYIQEYSGLLSKSIQQFLKTQDSEIRKSYYKMACQYYGKLSRVRPFTEKEQRKLVNDAIDQFVKADGLYWHPNRSLQPEKINNRKQHKEEFWSGVAEEEFFVDFMDDLFHKK